MGNDELAKSLHSATNEIIAKVETRSVDGEFRKFREPSGKLVSIAGNGKNSRECIG